MSIAAFIEGVSALGPAMAYEDVPISLCMYPFLKLESGKLVTRGLGQRRDGYAWGISASWDGKTPHYMVPAELLVAEPLRKPLYVTAAQPFDFIYRPMHLMLSLEHDAHVRSKKNKLTMELAQPGSLGMLIDEIKKIVEGQAFFGDLPAGFVGNLEELLTLADTGFMEDKMQVALCHEGGELVGFAFLWFCRDTCFHVHRTMRHDKRSATRSFDHFLANVAHVAGCSWLNMGDAHRYPGIASYKSELKPSRLGFYVNLLDREELADYDLPADVS